MRFSIFATILTAALAIAAPSPNTSDGSQTDPSAVSAAVDLFHNLQATLSQHVDQLQATANSLTPDSSQADKDAATAAVSNGLSAMAQEIVYTTGQLATTASSPSTKIKSRDAGDLLSDLAAIATDIVKIVFAGIQIASDITGGGIPLQAGLDLALAIADLVQVGIKTFTDLGQLLGPLIQQIFMGLATSQAS